MKQRVQKSHYDNSHHTSEYSPFNCTNCGQCFGFFLGITQNPKSETLCFFCFENLPEPKEYDYCKKCTGSHFKGDPCQDGD